MKRAFGNAHVKLYTCIQPVCSKVNGVGCVCQKLATHFTWLADVLVKWFGTLDSLAIGSHLFTELSSEEEVIPTAVVAGLLRHGWVIDRHEQVGGLQ